MNLILNTKQEQKAFEFFSEKFSLTSLQQEQFLTYIKEIITTNNKFNITAITDVKSILKDHFADSLSLMRAINLHEIKSIVDVGTGGGFPIVPIKIMFPHLHIRCIEVNQKKVAFLHYLAEIFGFENFQVIDDDWRNFLRHNKEESDLVIARASLSVEELFRMFKGASVLKSSKLVYWASKKWIAEAKYEKSIDQVYEYKIGEKKRKLIFFADQAL